MRDYVGQKVTLTGPREQEIPVLVSVLHQHVTGWEVECMLAASPLPIRSGQRVAFPDGSVGLISRFVWETDMVAAGSGYLPGRSSAELTIQGPAA
jgi:hypothetical protein